MDQAVRILEYRGIRPPMSKDGQTDKMLITEKEAALGIPKNMSKFISAPVLSTLGELPHSPIVSKIREISYCTEGIGNRWTYRIWRNMPYASGYSDTMIGGSRRQLTTSELAHGGRYFWNSVFGTSSEYRISIQSAMWGTLIESRFTIELLPKSAPFGRPCDKQSITVDPEKKRPEPIPNDKDKSKNAQNKNIGSKGGG